MSQKTTNSRTISNIFLSRKIILNLAEQRGYDISDYNNFSINEIVIMYGNKQLDMFLIHPETGKKVYYKYHLATKVNRHHVYDYIEDLFNIEEILEPKDDLVIVSKDKATDNLIKMMDMEYKKKHYYVNIYNFNDYLYNILDNNLVPPHRVLSEEEKVIVAKKYNILESTQWPEISRFDPVAIAIGLRPENVVEITRPSPTALTTKYYRLCN